MIYKDEFLDICKNDDIIYISWIGKDCTLNKKYTIIATHDNRIVIRNDIGRFVHIPISYFDYKELIRRKTINDVLL